MACLRGRALFHLASRQLRYFTINSARNWRWPSRANHCNSYNFFGDPANLNGKPIHFTLLVIKK